MTGKIKGLINSLPGIRIATEPSYRISYGFDATGHRGDCEAVIFPRRLEDLSNRAYRITGSRLVLYLLRILSRPLLHLDFLRPGYPPYTIFLRAVRR